MGVVIAIEIKFAGLIFMVQDESIKTVKIMYLENLEVYDIGYYC